MERLVNELASGSSNDATVASEGATKNSAQQDGDQADARRKEVDAAAKTAEWFRSNVDRWKLDSLYCPKPKAKANDKPQQAATSHDTPRQGATTPPIQDPTGLSKAHRIQLDSIWDFEILELEQASACDDTHAHTPVETPLVPATCDEETEESDEDADIAETREDEAALGWTFADVTEKAVDDVCTRGAVTSPSCSESPAVAERTKCESAAVADARCQSPAVAETSLADTATLTPNPDQNLDLAEAASSQSQTVVEIGLPTTPRSPQPQESAKLPQSTTEPLPQQQPQHQPPPKQLPSLTGLEPPPLKWPPPRPPSRPDATPKTRSPSPMPRQAPPQKPAPPSKPEPMHSSVNSAPRKTNGSPPEAEPIPAATPKPPSIPERSKPAWALPNEMFRSAVAADSRQRSSSPSTPSRYYESIDSFEGFAEQQQMQRLTLGGGNMVDEKEPGSIKDAGNFGIQLYNMGTRSDPEGAHDNEKKQATRERMDDHLKKTAAQLNVCLECNKAVENLLRAPATDGADDPRPSGADGVLLRDRPTWEFHVCALEYVGKDTLMIAARTRSFSALVVLDGTNMMERPGEANSRLLVCKATTHRPIPGLGSEIIIFAVHANCKTMRKVWPEAYRRFWELVKWAIDEYQPHFLLGDFNMALMLVPRELSSRQIPCDVLAYSPWRFTGCCEPAYTQKLGLDSCGIFYVKGGDVEARVNWPASHIQRLLDAGHNITSTVVSDWKVELHTYDAHSKAPGKPWWNYRCTDRKQEGPEHKNLESMLKDFLTARTSQEQWQEAKGGNNEKVHWLRFRQKPMPQEAVFVNGKFHSGAHMNLMVFTENAISRRSKAAEERRKNDKRAARARNYAARQQSRPQSQPRSQWHAPAPAWGNRVATHCYSKKPSWPSGGNDAWHHYAW